MVCHSDAVRHDRVQLPLGAAATDTIVEPEIAGLLRWSHFDAFRILHAQCRATKRRFARPRHRAWLAAAGLPATPTLTYVVRTGVGSA
jgi:hypothetical protein